MAAATSPASTSPTTPPTTASVDLSMRLTVLGRHGRQGDGVLSLSGGDQLGELLLVQLEVVAAFAQQLVMVAALDDPPSVQDEHFVGGANRRQAVRDHQRGPASQQLV